MSKQLQTDSHEIEYVTPAQRDSFSFTIFKYFIDKTIKWLIKNFGMVLWKSMSYFITSEYRVWQHSSAKKYTKTPSSLGSFLFSEL